MIKARMEAGGKAKTQDFDIEDRYDDCGSDLSGLGPDFRAFLTDTIVELPCDDSQTDDDDDALVANLPLWCFIGSASSHDDSWPPPRGVRVARSINEMTEILVATPIGDDIVEFC